MGTEYTTSYFEVFHTLEGAKHYAAKHYNNTRGPIVWTKKGYGYCSQDLGYVMYTITPIKILTCDVCSRHSKQII
jgi:hypothetical protein